LSTSTNREFRTRRYPDPATEALDIHATPDRRAFPTFNMTTRIHEETNLMSGILKILSVGALRIWGMLYFLVI
jgi:hypothetical protein